MTSPTAALPRPEEPAALPPRPQLARGAEICGAFDGGGADAPVIVRRGDGQSLTLTPLLAALAGLLDGTRTSAEIAEVLREQTGKPVSTQNVEQLLAEQLVPLGLVENAGPEVVARANPLLAIRGRVQLLSPERALRVGGWCRWLFHPLVVVCVLAGFALAATVTLALEGVAGATREAFDRPGLMAALIGLTVISAGLHEFGHAAALVRAGGRPGPVGAGLYLVFPAFFTDVDDAYRLPRRARLLVDLGGLYVNALVCAALLAVWQLTGVEAVLLGIALQLVQMLRQLAPVIRADGYHILSDAVGVPDLFTQIKPTLRGLLPGRPAGPLHGWRRSLVCAWILVVVPLLAGLLLLAILLLPRIIASAYATASREIGEVGAALEEGAVLEGVLSLLAAVVVCLPPLGVLLVLAGLARRSLGKLWHSSAGSPPRRGGLVLAGLALLGLLAWAWAPPERYQPVSGETRGTLLELPSVLTPPTPVASRTGLAAPEAAAASVQQSALLLLPKDAPGEPALALLEEEGETRVLLLSPDGAAAPVPARVLPFELPDELDEQGLRALAANTTDGGVVYEVAVGLVTVRDGDSVTARNEAYALASCQSCTTVAASFQVVLIVGESRAVAPVNASVAGNKYCLQCITTALAYQLVVTVAEEPDAELRARIQEALAGLEALEAQRPDPAVLLAEIRATQDRIAGLLEDAGLVEPGVIPRVTPSTTPAPSPSGPSTSPTPAPTEPTQSPTGEPSPSSTPEESESSSSPEASSSPEPSQSAAPAESAAPSESAAPTPTPSS